MGKEDIINYVMTTPGNPNRAVLEGMLDSFSDGEGGGDEPKRILLYENDAVNVSYTDDNWVYGRYSGADALAFTNWISVNEGGNWILVVDDEEISTPLEGVSGSYYIGVENPGDTEHVGVNKIGCTVATSPTSNTNECVTSVTYLMLDKNYFTAGTHSVKIYKEV